MDREWVKDVNKAVSILEDMLKKYEYKRKNSYNGERYTEIVEELEKAIKLLVG
ncbi:MAG: hypothetical protein QM387_04730 [Spirochaetota bacterium]|nr:hypothetical protein [Spirochaetota bacterium]